ncbi:MAG TPA: hypothetical protein VJT50_03880, partial [Pyrinomonadaceae bacterium]|nr:hypothetical protein [Pyrinomonadaceae bacterium]
KRSSHALTTMIASTRVQKTNASVWHSNRTALLVLLALVPPVVTALFISHYWVDSHLADEWNSAVFFDKFAHGTLRIVDLFRLQNEYRQFFPNLVFLGVGWITKWDVRYWMALSFVAACLVSFNIYLLGKRTLDLSRQQRLGIYVLSNLLIFSPVQYENWIQGQQLIFFFPIVCITTAFVVCTSPKLSLTTKFLLCALAATVSTFSSANGIFCWVVVLPVLLASARSDERRKARWLGVVWVATFGVNVALYLYRFRNTPGHPSRLTIFQQPLDSSVYLLSLLGNPLTISSNKIAAALGILLIVVYAWLIVDFWRSRHSDGNNTQRSMIWLMLGAYSVLTAVMVTVARAGFGLVQSRSSRYTTFTLYLVVALLHLLAIKFLRPAVVRHELQRWFVARLVAGGLVLLHIGLYVIAVGQFSNFEIRFVQAKVCTVFINVIDSDNCAAISIHSDFNILKSRANAVDALGFLRPALAKTNRIDEIQDSDAVAGANGSFDEFRHSDAEEYIASGSAFLLQRRKPADAVLLVYERAGDPGRVFAIAYMNANRDYISHLLRRGTYGDVRWSAKLKVDAMQLNGATISAWAYDVKTGKAYRLPGSFAFPQSG